MRARIDDEPYKLSSAGFRDMPLRSVNAFARLPFSIYVDKNAAYPDAFASSRVEKVLPRDCKLRRAKYLNNIIKQDYCFIEKKVRASQCFKGFHTAERTIEGIEELNMMRKGRVKRLNINDRGGSRSSSPASFRSLHNENPLATSFASK